jgi:hypothetical protein
MLIHIIYLFKDFNKNYIPSYVKQVIFINIIIQYLSKKKKKNKPINKEQSHIYSKQIK